MQTITPSHGTLADGAGHTFMSVQPSRSSPFHSAPTLMLTPRVSNSQRRNSASVASGLARRCPSSAASWPDNTGGRCRPPRAEGVVLPVAARRSSAL
jgi:hypothetical protein